MPCLWGRMSWEASDDMGRFCQRSSDSRTSLLPLVIHLRRIGKYYQSLLIIFNMCRKEEKKLRVGTGGGESCPRRPAE
jgi:hypothetical protein